MAMQLQEWTMKKTMHDNDDEDNQDPRHHTPFAVGVADNKERERERESARLV